MPASIMQNLKAGETENIDFNFQVTYNKYDAKCVVVTGMDTFKYY